MHNVRRNYTYNKNYLNFMPHWCSCVVVGATTPKPPGSSNVSSRAWRLRLLQQTARQSDYTA